MDNDDLKLIQEIEEIEKAKTKIVELLVQHKTEELSYYLNYELSLKYALEKELYNVVNPDMPRTTEENAKNALQFLDNLKRAKIAQGAMRGLQ